MSSAASIAGGTVLQIVATLDDTPTSREVVDVAHALLRAGARALVAGGSGSLVSELQGLGGEWIHLDTSSRNPLRIRATARAIGDVVTAERVDLIHARAATAARSAALARSRFPARLVTSFSEDYWSPLRAEKAYMQALAVADRVIAPSRYVADFMVKNSTATPAAIHVIPPRIDTERFDPAAVSRERASHARRTWKTPANERVLLVPGRIDPDKGQLTLVEVARILVNGGLERTSFVLVGNARTQADYAQALAAQAEAHGVADLIHPVGLCTDMAAAYATADFVVVPAHAPPAFSRAAAEAQAMGRPVIAPATGAIAEIVLAPPRHAAETRTGWLARGDEPIMLARAIAAALGASPTELRAISVRARDHAEATYAPARIAADTVAVYRSQLEGPR